MNFRNFKQDNPEYIKKKYQDLNIEKLISEIEKKIKFKLKFNNPFPGEKGISTSKGILSIREIQAIYQAYRIKEIIKHNKYKIKNVLEFGGGLGELLTIVINLESKIIRQLIFWFLKFAN